MQSIHMNGLLSRWTEKNIKALRAKEHMTNLKEKKIPCFHRLSFHSFPHLTSPHFFLFRPLSTTFLCPSYILAPFLISYASCSSTFSQTLPSLPIYSTPPELCFFSFPCIIVSIPSSHLIMVLVRLVKENFSLKNFLNTLFKKGGIRYIDSKKSREWMITL